MSMSKKDFIALADAIVYANHCYEEGVTGTNGKNGGSVKASASALACKDAAEGTVL